LENLKNCVSAAWAYFLEAESGPYLKNLEIISILRIFSFLSFLTTFDPIPSRKRTSELKKNEKIVFSEFTWAFLAQNRVQSAQNRDIRFFPENWDNFQFF